MAASQAGYFTLQQFTDGGLPLVGGRLYTYAAGTTTLKTAFTDPAGAVPQTYTADGLGGSYIALNTRAELPAPLYLATGSYDIALKRPDGSTVWTRQADPTSDVAAALAINLANSSNLANGAGLVAFNKALAYAAGTVGFKLSQQPISVVDFGADPTGVSDSTAAIAAAWAASKYITFPAGVYNASAMPNFAVNNARVETIGRVVINYTGTGNGLIIDAGATSGVVKYNIFIGPMTISGNVSATNGVYIRGITHSNFVKLRPINFPVAAMRCEFMVTNSFLDFCCSGNEGGLTIASVNGIVLEKRNAGEQSSDCTFINTIIEGTSGNGIQGNELGQCTFIGGTSEGNGFGGGAGAIYLGPNSFGNTFIGMDMEANGKAGDVTSYHVKDFGSRNKFINPLCDSVLTNLFWSAGGNSGSIEGGTVYSLQIDAGVKNYQTRGLSYGGTVTDNGTSSRHIQRFSTPGAVVDMADSYIQTKSWTPVPSGLTVSGTPSYAGTYQQIGRMILFTIQATSTVSTTNAGGVSFTLPIAASVIGTCSGASNNTGQAVGKGVGSIAATLCYPPTWPADSSITISGSYFSA